MTVANYNKSDAHRAALQNVICRAARAAAVRSPLRRVLFLSAALRESLTRPLSSMPDALDPDHVADFCDVLRSFDAEIRKLGNVTSRPCRGKTSDKGAELLHGNDAALIGLADLDFARHAADNFFARAMPLAAGA